MFTWVGLDVQGLGPVVVGRTAKSWDALEIMHILGERGRRVLLRGDGLPDRKSGDFPFLSLLFPSFSASVCLTYLFFCHSFSNPLLVVRNPFVWIARTWAHLYCSCHIHRLSTRS